MQAHHLLPAQVEAFYPCIFTERTHTILRCYKDAQMKQKQYVFFYLNLSHNLGQVVIEETHEITLDFIMLSGIDRSRGNSLQYSLKRTKKLHAQPMMDGIVDNNKY
ncbi:hypothetical protein ACJX0J_026915, partial [Zea mays]